MAKKKIKEDRATREEDTSLVNPFYKLVKREREGIDKYDDRADMFWEEIEGIKDLLNTANSKFKITDHRDQTITQYILWRILNELKLAREDSKLNQVNKERLKEELGLS